MGTTSPVQEKASFFSSSEDRPASFTLLARLTIFFSWIGIHRFYVGKYYTGSLLIVLFFTVNTLSTQAKDASHPLHSPLLLAQMMTMGIQMHDLFKVCFGFFKDAHGNSIKLSIDAAIPSNLQLGPLLIWAAFLGVFGGHNFYARKYKNALLQLCTLGGLGIWTIYEIWQITQGQFKDTQGRPVAHIYTKSPHIDAV